MKLTATFAGLTPDLSVDPIPVSPSIDEQLEARFDRFRGHVLCPRHAFDADRGVWERLPAGDVVVALLSGATPMRLLSATPGEATDNRADPAAEGA